MFQQERTACSAGLAEQVFVWVLWSSHVLSGYVLITHVDMHEMRCRWSLDVMQATPNVTAVSQPLVSVLVLTGQFCMFPPRLDQKVYVQQQQPLLVVR